MSFSSIEFLFIFLPVFLIIYHLLPSRFKSASLLVGSLVFYWFAVKNVWMLLLPVIFVLMAYIFGLVARSDRYFSKIFLFVCLVIDFGVLVIFKYAGLLTSTTLIAPAGLSFYIFTITGYMIGVYRGTQEPESDILKFSTGMLMFPKLLSGPIARYSDISEDLSTPGRISYKAFDSGLRELILGLALKVLLADRIGGLWSQIKTMGFSTISMPFAWLGIIAFSLQLYFDFYGYSLMAIGLGRMLGFELPVNFRHPYASKSMTEFWRRWHITLGTWFRENLYIPLGGNRVNNTRMYINLLIVWVCTGLWHGSTLNFLLWGIFLFALIALEKHFGLDKKQSPLMHVYMFFAILISWSFFAVTDVKSLFVFLGRLFHIFSSDTVVLKNDWLVYGRQYLIQLIVGIVLALPFPAKIWKKIRSTPVGSVILFCAFWLSIFFLAVGKNDPFMYFNF